MTLVYIVLVTLAGGLLSVVIAASLTLAVLSRVVKGLVLSLIHISEPTRPY